MNLMFKWAKITITSEIFLSMSLRLMFFLLHRKVNRKYKPRTNRTWTLAAGPLEFHESLSFFSIFLKKALEVVLSHMKFPSSSSISLLLIERFCVGFSEFTSLSLAIFQPAFGNVLSLPMRRKMTSWISSYVRIWKVRLYGPGCNFVWILRVVYFPVKHSRLYNKYAYLTGTNSISTVILLFYHPYRLILQHFLVGQFQQFTAQHLMVLLERRNATSNVSCQQRNSLSCPP